jgi:hypothetical protein
MSVSGGQWDDRVSVAERVVGEFLEMIGRGPRLGACLLPEVATDARPPALAFLQSELRGESTLTPWSNVRGKFTSGGLSGEYHIALGHFMFSSPVPSATAARIVERIEWSDRPDALRDMEGAEA